MAEATYALTTTTEGTSWSQEMPATAVTGHPYLEHVAPLCVMNFKDSGKILRVKEIYAQPLDNVSSVTVANVLTLQRITALTGGEAVSAIKLDSNKSDLPSQVSCAVRPATITTTGAALTQIAKLPRWNSTRAAALLPAAYGLRLGRGQFWKWPCSSDLQRIVLREGEGIALHSTSASGMVSNSEIEIEIHAVIVSTGASYVFKTQAVGGTLAHCALINGSGSGVVLEVADVIVHESGEDALPQFNVEALDGAGLANCGTALTPISYDSSNSLSASVACYRNAVIKTSGWKDGAFIVIPYKRRQISPLMNRNASNIAAISCRESKVLLFSSTHSDTDLILREGCGVAVMQRNAGKYGHYELGISFLQEDASAPSPPPPASGAIYMAVSGSFRML